MEGTAGFAITLIAPILIGAASLLLGSLQLAMAFVLRVDHPVYAAVNFVFSCLCVFNVLLSIDRIRSHVRFKKARSDFARHLPALASAIKGCRNIAAEHHCEQAQAALERMRKIADKD